MGGFEKCPGEDPDFPTDAEAIITVVRNLFNVRRYSRRNDGKSPDPSLLP